MALLTGRPQADYGKRFIRPSVAGGMGLSRDSAGGLPEIMRTRLGMPMPEPAIVIQPEDIASAEPARREEPDITTLQYPAVSKAIVHGDAGAMGVNALIGGTQYSVPPFLPTHVDVDRALLSLGYVRLAQRDYGYLANRFKLYLLNTAYINVEAFAARPEHTLLLDGRRVMFGSPMKTGKYESIPVYIDDDTGRTRLVIAYRSASQACWRRFAGRHKGIYWKGEDEHLQNFHHHIQQKLDGIYDSVQGRDIVGPDGSILSLDSLGMSAEGVCGGNAISTAYQAAADLIEGTELALQRGMPNAQERFDINDIGNKPHLLLNFWWAGNAEDPYGRHVNLIVLSRNLEYQYCLALTDDGMFPKYIQPASGDRINNAGAPADGVPVPEEDRWLLTPIVEYDSQSAVVSDRPSLKADIHATVVAGNRRVRILGVHDNCKSPFHEMNNGMSEYYRLLRAECFEQVDAKLRRIILDHNGVLPGNGVAPSAPAVPRAFVDQRLQELLEAYELFSAGRLDEANEEGRREISRLSITERERALFKRYRTYMESWQGENGEIPLFARHTFVQRLRRVAEKHAQDQESATVSYVA